MFIRQVFIASFLVDRPGWLLCYRESIERRQSMISDFKILFYVFLFPSQSSPTWNTIVFSTRHIETPSSPISYDDHSSTSGPSSSSPLDRRSSPTSLPPSPTFNQQPCQQILARSASSESSPAVAISLSKISLCHLDLFAKDWSLFFALSPLHPLCKNSRGENFWVMDLKFSNPIL